MTSTGHVMGGFDMMSAGHVTGGGGGDMTLCLLVM